MLEGSMQSKSEEQYPLLMVSGAGDATVRAPPPVIDSLLWNTTVVPKRPWSERWPEYLSTCWMTFILLGISFLVFYAVGMVVIYRHEAYILVKCNETKPATDVFYHHVIPRGTPFPLSNYADYLANVASLYPHLRFYVYFLVDDSIPAKNSFLENIYPCYEEYNIYNRREVKIFQKTYPNVNITVMHLSKYMAITPLKYRWRGIPTPYISFYARTFAVWLNGGMGLDLVTHNQQFHLTNPKGNDRKTRTLLKQHNDGIFPEKYIEAINKLEFEEETEILSSFFNVVEKLLTDRLSIFSRKYTTNTSTDNSSIDKTTINSGMETMGTVIPQYQSNVLVRTHRNKRDNVKMDIISPPPIVNIILANGTNINVTGSSFKDNIYQITSNELNVTEDNKDKMGEPNLVTDDNGWHLTSVDNSYNYDLPKSYKTPNIVYDTEKKNNDSESPHIVLFYDFLISEPIRSDILLTSTKNVSTLKFVTLDEDGSFVSSTTRLHPFLGSILSAGCQRLSPKFAIQNALYTHCSGPLRDENYCNSIYVL